MARQDRPDLLSFATVASEGRFTRAAERLGVTQSALSHAKTGLETRVGMRLQEHVPTKWIPVRRRKCGKIKELE
ncbi:helix-turn-helix domain-containing protein [Methylobacterium aquaticum]|uniref:HTH lysR-type domain-containing protein n=1 Tax=Methylobacterium aquaticum TaxID=270351 RepID=A0A0J6S8I4_9HYPH|nr:hypothetical protein VP06_19720 [Methylobacterium aquaticum]